MWHPSLWSEAIRIHTTRKLSPSPPAPGTYRQTICRKNRALAELRAIMRVWKERCKAVGRFGAGSPLKPERNRSLGTTRRLPVNRFACNKLFENSETYVSQNGENAGPGAGFRPAGLSAVSDLHQLLGRLPRFVARFRRQIAHPELHANLLEEVVRRHAAREHPHEIVGNFLLRAVHIQNDGFRLELHRIRLEHHVQL